MCRRSLINLLVPFALCGLLAAGCGTDDDGGSNGGAADTGQAADVGADTGQSADTDGEDAGATDPQIVSLEVNPDTILQHNIGMTDEFVDVTITVSGFEGEIPADDDHIDVFLQLSENREAVPHGGFFVQGGTITLTRIAKTWFQGLETGQYPVGATVRSDANESVTELDLATVDIVE